MLVEINGNTRRHYLAEDTLIQGILIPKGTSSDGISGSLFISRMLGKFDPRYSRAVFLHDYLTDREEYELADRLFDLELRETSISKTKRLLILVGVIGWHRIKYKTEYKENLKNTLSRNPNPL